MVMAGRHATADAEAQRPTWQMVCGFLVVLGAGAVTAHGLFEVATNSKVPKEIAWIYPVITDGLALVAYASAAHLEDRARRYAWTVVILAAGMSGLAQAALLASGMDGAPVLLRFGIGAWPAVAAAISAHLLFLLREARQVKAQMRTQQEQQAWADAEQQRRRDAEAAAEAESRRRIEEMNAKRLADEAEAARIAAEKAPPKPQRKRATTRPAAAKHRKTTQAPAPEIGTGSARQRMLAYLDEHADEALAGTITGGELDRLFDTNNYGRGVLKAWREKHEKAQAAATAVGE